MQGGFFLSEISEHGKNRGEFSELFVFLKSLKDKKILVLGSELTGTKDRYYDVRGVIRREGKIELRYMLRDDGSADLFVNGGRVSEYTISRDVIEKGTEFVDYILDEDRKSGSKGIVSLSDAENCRLIQMMGELHINNVSQDSTSTTDITLIVYDEVTKEYLYLPFSIKSFVGANPTLFNASGATNFIYRLKKEISDSEITEINATYNNDVRGWVIKKTSSIYNKYGLEFISVQTNNGDVSLFDGNLRLIDSRLPEILSELLLLKYTTGKNNIAELVGMLEKKNPMNFIGNQPFYRYKISEFLMASFTGMRPSTLWTGYEEVHGGYIIVTRSKTILCFPLSNRNSFMDYLFKNTYLETGSTSRHGFASVFRTSGEVIYKLNLDVRFMEKNEYASYDARESKSVQETLF